MPKQLDLRIQYKYDKESNWNSLGNIPPSGELLFYEPSEEHDKIRLKIGDGLHVPVELPWAYIGEYGEEPEPTVISSVSLTVNGLTRDNTPQNTSITTNTEGCTATISYWSKDSDILDNSTKFEELTSYNVHIKLEADNRHIFGGNIINVDVNNQIGYSQKLYTDKTVIEFTVPLECPDDPSWPEEPDYITLYNVDLALDGCEHGNTLNDVSIDYTYPDDSIKYSFYKINSITETFVGGKSYTIQVELSAKEGYEFSSSIDNINVKINGQLISNKEFSNSSLKIYYTTTASYAQEKAKVPTQRESLTFNGTTQSPSWNNYNTDVMTLSTSEGTSSAWGAGQYYAIFKLKNGYQWEDGTTADKQVPWTIEKAYIAYTLTGFEELEEYTVNLTNLRSDALEKSLKLKITSSHYTGTVSITNRINLEDSIKVEITDNNVVINGEKCTTNAVSGSFDIVLPADNNYNSASKTVYVKTTLADTILNNNDWSIINEAAVNGVAGSIWNVGDVKQVRLNNYKVTTSNNVTESIFGNFYAYIIDFNRDNTYSIEFQCFKLLNSQDVALIDNDYPYSVYPQNLLKYTGYAFSLNSECGSGLENYGTEYGPPSWVNIYKRALVPMYNSFDEKLKAVTVTFNSVKNINLRLYVTFGDAGYHLDGSDGAITETQTNNNEGFKLILPSCSELSSSAELFHMDVAEGVDWGDLLTLSYDDSKIYKYYKSGNNIIKRKYNNPVISESCMYWTRDIMTYTTHYAGDMQEPGTAFSALFYDNYYDAMLSKDEFQSEVYNRSLGITPIFRVGNANYTPD